MSLGEMGSPSPIGATSSSISPWPVTGCGMLREKPTPWGCIASGARQLQGLKVIDYTYPCALVELPLISAVSEHSASVWQPGAQSCNQSILDTLPRELASAHRRCHAYRNVGAGLRYRQ